MAKAEDELKHFTAFVYQRIASGSASDLGLSELFDLWMLDNPTEADFAGDVAAINASINDFMKGQRGTPGDRTPSVGSHRTKSFPFWFPPNHSGSSTATSLCRTTSPSSSVSSFAPLRLANSASQASVTCLGPLSD